MARINIEQSIFSDYRFIELQNKVGDYYRAIGLLICAWMMAQKYYLNEETDRFIPLNEWNRTPFGPILDVGLAIKTENGIRLCGSDEQFKWLLQRQNAGKKGGRPKKENRPLLPDKVPLSPVNPLTPTPTLTLTLNKEKIYICENENSNSELFEIWNQNVIKLNKAIKETKQRKDKAKALWKQNPDKDYWINVIKRMESSLFCTGTNNNGWKAGYDFFLKPDTFLNVLEGKYDNPKNAQNKNNLTQNKTSYDRNYTEEELDKLLGIK